MKFKVSGRTDVGIKRRSNEDSFDIDRQLGLFIVADGMGGHAAGEVASKMAIDVTTDYIKRTITTDEPYLT
ncbi:MAG: protein phosphatase 2C domain-containing protein, partial [Desulfobulbaceae bacterium]|nr:protein phosphatase 2C domain-containing protein [Desulfobulbaceae bacterium]